MFKYNSESAKWTRRNERHIFIYLKVTDLLCHSLLVLFVAAVFSLLAGVRDVRYAPARVMLASPPYSLVDCVKKWIASRIALMGPFVLMFPWCVRYCQWPKWKMIRSYICFEVLWTNYFRNASPYHLASSPYSGFRHLSKLGWKGNCKS